MPRNATTPSSASELYIYLIDQHHKSLIPLGLRSPQVSFHATVIPINLRRSFFTSRYRRTDYRHKSLLTFRQPSTKNTQLFPCVSAHDHDFGIASCCRQTTSQVPQSRDQRLPVCDQHHGAFRRSLLRLSVWILSNFDFISSTHEPQLSSRVLP